MTASPTALVWGLSQYGTPIWSSGAPHNPAPGAAAAAFLAVPWLPSPLLYCVQDPTFRTAAAARWKQLRTGPDAPLGDAWFISEVDALKRQLGSGPGSAGQRNWLKWSAALNKPDYGPAFPDWPSMFNAETKLLLDWILARLKWLDAAFAAEADPAAAPDAYLRMGFVVAEPPTAGPSNVAQGGLPAVAGK